MMAKIIKFVKKFFTKFDLFPATQYLRYKEEAEFKTATGGLVSIVIIIIFIIVFQSLAMQTLNKDIIYGSVSNKM